MTLQRWLLALHSTNDLKVKLTLNKPKALGQFLGFEQSALP